ncbi:MAG: hypothetical protein GY788_13035 [bacterium]|nr:hypothetical protein [bacterium]
MIELLMFLATRLGYLLEPGRFKIINSLSSRSQGGDALIDLESATLRMRLTHDRGQILMSFQPLASSADWFSPGLLRGLLTGERPKSEVLDDAWAKELNTTLAELERRLADPDEAEPTVRELRRQAKLRAKELFG